MDMGRDQEPPAGGSRPVTTEQPPPFQPDPDLSSRSSNVAQGLARSSCGSLPRRSDLPDRSTRSRACHHPRAVKERVLSTRELNRALLAHQLLLDRARLPLTRALERVAGLQTQYAPSGYVGLWSRLRDFRRDELTRALERRRAVQGTLMRVTIHTVSALDYPLFAAGVRKSRREWWLRTNRKQIEGLDMEAVAARLRVHLGGGPRRRAELSERLRADGFPPVAWSGAGLWLDMVRVPP